MTLPRNHDGLITLMLKYTLPRRYRFVFGVIFHRCTGADEIAVAEYVVDSSYGWPELVTLGVAIWKHGGLA